MIPQNIFILLNWLIVTNLLTALVGCRSTQDLVEPQTTEKQNLPNTGSIYGRIMTAPFDDSFPYRIILKQQNEIIAVIYDSIGLDPFGYYAVGSGIFTFDNVPVGNYELVFTSTYIIDNPGYEVLKQGASELDKRIYDDMHQDTVSAVEVFDNRVTFVPNTIHRDMFAILPRVDTLETRIKSMRALSVPRTSPQMDGVADSLRHLYPPVARRSGRVQGRLAQTYEENGSMVPFEEFRIHLAPFRYPEPGVGEFSIPIRQDGTFAGEVPPGIYVAYIDEKSLRYLDVVVLPNDTSELLFPEVRKEANIHVFNPPPSYTAPPPSAIRLPSPYRLYHDSVRLY